MDQQGSEENSGQSGVPPPSYADVVQSKMMDGTLARLDPGHSKRTSFYGEAPPSYLHLFGVKSSVASPPRVTIVPVQANSPTESDHDRSSNSGSSQCGSIYRQAARKNRTVTVMYCCFFFAGIFLALAMIGAGCSTLDETVPEDATDVSSPNIWIGGLLLFFVAWHTLALLCGVCAKETGHMLEAYWCVRVCHCGCYCWSYQLIPYSITVWIGLQYGSIFPSSLVWFVVSCVVIQYIIVLYCIFELIIDIRLTHIQCQSQER